MAQSNINLFNEDIDFTLENSKETINWITNTIKSENKILGEINIIFCSDKYLLELNQNYLKHDTFTDVITFDYVEDTIISGDIFISIERVEENANNLNTPLTSELLRVMIHGVLHLIGYSDKTVEEQQEIRGKEDFYLALLREN